MDTGRKNSVLMFMRSLVNNKYMHSKIVLLLYITVYDMMIRQKTLSINSDFHRRPTAATKRKESSNAETSCFGKTHEHEHRLLSAHDGISDRFTVHSKICQTQRLVLQPVSASFLSGGLAPTQADKTVA